MAGNAQQVWFTADTHFGHANILKYSGRPFDGDVERHDRALVANWNANVGPRDLVYHLGDFAFKSTQSAAEYRRKLNGQIYLIEGNHDSAARADANVFLHVGQVAEVKVNGQRVWLSHYAHRVWPRSHKGSWHLYGHSHGSLADDPNALSLDVGVDAHAARLAGRGERRPEDYRPMRFEEVAALMEQKTFVPIDHHGR